MICLSCTIDARPTVQACIQAEFGFTPVGTQRQVTFGQETGAHGSLIYSRKGNTKITDIWDLRNKRIGVGRIQSAATFLLAFEVFATTLQF